MSPTHSLMATRLVARLRAILGIELNVEALMENPSVEKLESILRGNRGADRLFNRLLPLRRIGSRPPLFCLPPAGGLGWVYAGLMRRLSPEQPIYCLQAPGIGEPTSFPASMSATAADYIDVMRSVQAEGPYHLIGWSFGGLVAHFMACRLQNLQERVAFLGILDAYPPVARNSVPPDVAELHRSLHVFGFSAEVEDRICRLILHANSIKFADQMPRFNGEVVLLSTPENSDLGALWTPYVSGKISSHEIECKHSEMLDSAPVNIISKILDCYLQNSPRLGFSQNGQSSVLIGSE